MNKVINIRLGNYVLTIDEDAASTISHYTEALRRKYANEDGAKEIVSDIEDRMGELLDKKQKEQFRNYSTLEDVQAVISQMGPLDSHEENDNQSYESSSIRRRLYRDPENRILGGVWGGISAYFDMDPVLLRVVWILSVFVFGFGIPLYIILWVVIPEAKTTSEKLMMKGQRPTLKNFEQNIKSELNDVSDRLNNPKTHERISAFLRNMVVYIGRFAAILIKFIFSVAGAILLMVLIGTLIAVSTNSIYVHTYHLVLNGQEGLNVLLSAAGNPFWIKIAAIGFILILIAWMGLLVFSNRNNYDRVRLSRRYLSWAATIALLILFVFAFDGFRSIGTRSEKTVYKDIIHVTGDTLEVNSDIVNTEEKGLYTLNEFADILPSDDNHFYIEQKNTTFGHNRISSSVRNENMSKQYAIENNSILLQQGTKISDLRKSGLGWVHYVIYVPKGKTIKSGKAFHFPENNYTPLANMGTNFTMDTNGFIGSAGSNAGIPLDPFVNSLELSGKFEVQIIPSQSNRIELVSGPILNHRDWLNIQGSEISIDEDNNWFNERPSFIRIYLNNLAHLEVNSVTKVKFQKWKTNVLEIDLSGAASMEGDLEVHELNMDLDGAAKAEFSGTADHLIVETSGAAGFNALEFKAKKADVNSSGASSLAIWVLDELIAESSGASTLSVKGNPPNSKVNTHGASGFKKL
jgi:phage shock protein PspC (stress-responsive transcriptional regulator)